MAFGSKEEVQNTFWRWWYAGHLIFPTETILAVFDLQVTTILPIKFWVKWPFSSGEKVQNKLQDGGHDGHLGFLIWTILAIFYLQVILIFLMKFRVNWPFRWGEKFQNRLSSVQNFRTFTVPIICEGGIIVSINLWVGFYSWPIEVYLPGYSIGCYIKVQKHILVLFSFLCLWCSISLKIQIKALTALVGRFSLSVGWENGPEQGLRLFHLTLSFL